MSVEIPSSPNDRKKIKDAVVEIAKIMQRVSDDNSAKRDILKSIKDEYKIPPKHVQRLAKILLKNNFQDTKAEFEDFEALYDILMGRQN